MLASLCLLFGRLSAAKQTFCVWVCCILEEILTTKPAVETIRVFTTAAAAIGGKIWPRFVRSPLQHADVMYTDIFATGMLNSWVAGMCCLRGRYVINISCLAWRHDRWSRSDDWLPITGRYHKWHGHADVNEACSRVQQMSQTDRRPTEFVVSQQMFNLRLQYHVLVHLENLEKSLRVCLWCVTTVVIVTK